MLLVHEFQIIVSASSKKINVIFFVGQGNSTRRCLIKLVQLKPFISDSDTYNFLQIIQHFSLTQVMSGEAEADKELGRQLMQVVRAVPHLDTDTLTNMLNSHMQVQDQGFEYFLLLICI